MAVRVAPLGPLLGTSWGPLGPSGAPPGPSWGPSWAAGFGRYWGLRGPSGAVQGASWAVVVAVKTPEANMLNICNFTKEFDEFCLSEASWMVSWSSLGLSGASLEASGSSLGPSETRRCRLGGGSGPPWAAWTAV